MLLLIATMYTPGANAISGGDTMANGSRPYMGAVACPYSIKFGTRLEATGKVKEWLKKEGMKTSFVCADRLAKRFGSGHIDICLPKEWNGWTNSQRLKKAFEFGKVKSEWRIIGYEERKKRNGGTGARGSDTSHRTTPRNDS